MKTTITNDDTKVQALEVLIRALGTMVLEPQFNKDPNDIAGKPVYSGNIQKPILEGDIRTLTLDKLKTIVESL